MIPIGYMKDLGHEIRARRKMLGVSQSTVADLAGVSRKAVSEIERGKPTVRIDVLIKVVAAVGMRLELR